MSDIKENIEKFVNAVKDGNYNEAQDMFSGLVGDKLEDRLEAEKIAVAGSIFNGDDEDLDLDELGEEELEDELEEAKKYKKEEEDDDEDDEDDEEDDEDDEEDDEEDDDDEQELKEKKPKKKHHNKK